MRQIALPGARKRRWASKLIKLQPDISPAQISQAITVVCISDTHGHTPALPDGDLLLHAGDMTEWGSFDEIQAQLSWLSAQPHKYKVVIAGNHDVLLDDEYMAQNADRLPWKKQGIPSPARSELDFGSCIYLENESISLQFDNGREIRIFGCPLTPKSAGNSAFQIPRNEDSWTSRVPMGTDVIVSHGPLYQHLDGFPPAGCAYLLQEVMRIRPHLVVCGHIHHGHGREARVFDQARCSFEGIMAGWYSYEALLVMAFSLLWSRLCRFPKLLKGNTKTATASKLTTLVNASVVSGPANKLSHEAILVQI